MRAQRGQVVHVDAAMSAYIRGVLWPRFVAEAAPGGILPRARTDAAQSAFFERELMQTLGRTYDYQYPALLGRTFVPVSHELAPGATTRRYLQYNKLGRAAVIRDYADDLPQVQVVGKEFFLAPQALGVSYKYTIDELATAVVASMNGAPGPSLDQRRAVTAREAVEKGLDDIMAKGDGQSGLLGLLNQPNIITYTVAAGGGGSTYWKDKTPLEVYNDLNGIATAIVNTTNGVEVPDTIIVPINPYQYLTQPMTLASPVTVLKYFLNNNPYIKYVERWYHAKAAGSGGLDRMVCYRRDPTKLACQISREFTQEAPQPKNLTWLVPCHAKTFGVECYYPKSIAYGDGIGDGT